jgi:hypothetical protein
VTLFMENCRETPHYRLQGSNHVLDSDRQFEFVCSFRYGLIRSIVGCKPLKTARSRQLYVTFQISCQTRHCGVTNRRSVTRPQASPSISKPASLQKDSFLSTEDMHYRLLNPLPSSPSGRPFFCVLESFKTHWPLVVFPVSYLVGHTITQHFLSYLPNYPLSPFLL